MMALLTTGEVAERLTVCPRTVRALIKSGNISAIRIGSEYRVDEADLNRFIEHSRIPSKVEG